MQSLANGDAHHYYHKPDYLNYNHNSITAYQQTRAEKVDRHTDTSPSPASTKKLLQSLTELNELPVDCVGRRRQPIGEKCFTVMILFLVSGIVLVSFGTSCVISVTEVDKTSYCKMIGGLITALLLICGGIIMIIVGVSSCILIHECSGRELHGGRCHINCHVFEDLVE